MKVVATIVALFMVVAVGNAQTPVSSFPYSYAWTGGAAFALQADGHTCLYGGDGHWNCYRVGTTPGWVVGTANATSNVKDAFDTLFVVIDATGRSFDGSEVFTFDAWRGGGNTGSLAVYANGTQILAKDVATDLSTSASSFAAFLPQTLGNSVFTLYIVVNATKNGVVVDNTGIQGGALPITLASLKLDLSAGSPVLTWKTISEIDNYGFYVQKSQDMTNWTDVANSFQAGHGTTTVEEYYSFTDNTLPAGKYYRLHQVDLDGTGHYTEAVSVVASVEPAPLVKEFALGQSYPNPFNPTTTVRYSVGGTADGGRGVTTRLAVYDLLGREVAVLVNEPKAPGSYEVRFDGRGLSSGVYYYRLTAGNFTDVKRMMLMK